ncbi:hypothetical protein ENBRE01_1501 [Enteropsectra breve]|nr:hypothetical protein ENBRE01_1501 [Enteropsectra breve]
MNFIRKEKYYWNNMYTTGIHNYAKSCVICLKQGGARINTTYRTINTSQIIEVWECDLIGRIPTKSGKDKYILTIIDHYSKWVTAYTINTKDSDTILKLLDKIVRENGTPNKIISDLGREFDNSIVKQWSAENQIE